MKRNCKTPAQLEISPNSVAALATKSIAYGIATTLVHRGTIAAAHENGIGGTR